MATTTSRNRVGLENDAGRVDALAKVTGAAKYTYDINLPGMIYARHIRAPWGNAKLVTANVSAARAVPGVLDVQITRGGEDSPSLYAGQSIGHVCAESWAQIQDGLAALQMEWELIEAPATNFRRLSAGLPDLTPEEQASIDKVAASAAHAVTGNFFTQVQHHVSLEPHGLVVDYQGDRARVWGSSQAIWSFRDREIKSILELESPDIEFNADYVGGGFGSKFGAGIEGRLAAMMSKQFERPCKVMNTRKDENRDTGVRPGSRQYFELYADEDGKITGSRIHYWGAVGARGGGGGVSPCDYELGVNVPGRRQRLTEVRLAQTPVRPQRAPSFPQGSWGMEGSLDELAKKVGLDPIEIRKRNDLRLDRHRLLDLAASEIGWERRRPDGEWPGVIKHGFGLGAHQWHNNNFAGCGIEIRVHRDGGVEVRSGTQDIGTGTRTLIVDLTAHQMNLDRRFIRGMTGRTEYPQGPGSGGSTVSRSISPVVMLAADRAKEAILGRAAGQLNVEPATLSIAGDKIVDASGAAQMDWTEACSLIIEDHVAVNAESSEAVKYRGGGDSNGMCAVEVAVDTETGVVRVVKLVNIQRVGLVVNRKLVESQVVGAAIQGISYALFENHILNVDNGAVVNPNMEWYKIAGPADMPEIVPILDVPADHTGVRAAGEPPIVGVPGAMGNAVANAIGARVYSMPITPAAVLAALS